MSKLNCHRHLLTVPGEQTILGVAADVSVLPWIPLSLRLALGDRASLPSSVSEVDFETAVSEISPVAYETTKTDVKRGVKSDDDALPSSSQYLPEGGAPPTCGENSLSGSRSQEANQPNDLTCWLSL